MTKKEIVKILLTALISAGIAFLQNLLATQTGETQLMSNPEVAGGIGATLSALNKYIA